MRKLFLLFAMLISLAVSTQAQTTQVATLSHEGTVTTYYGESALTQAHEAAVDGDVITLSPGVFGSSGSGVIYIGKAVTIRGAGMELENNPTIIERINIGSSDQKDFDKHFTLEGVYVPSYVDCAWDLNNPVFSKIYAAAFYLESNTVINVFCTDCIFDYAELKEGTASFINCFINTKTIYPTSAYFGNCVINIYDYSTPYNSIFSNCIFLGSSGSSLGSSCTATYCYYQGNNKDFFSHLYPSSDTNHIVDSGVVIFKEGTTYELSDDLATTWLGDDGTQVGIYGGIMPFNPVLPIPRITKFNVARKTTEDGKLSVEIEIKSN